MALCFYITTEWLYHFIVYYLFTPANSHPLYCTRRAKQPKSQETKRPTQHQYKAKPSWVKKEVIRLSALMPHTGCRKIASTFNRIYSTKKHMTVSKSFVSYTLKNHQYEIQALRQTFKHKKSPPFPSHQLWSLDLTHTVDDKNQPHQWLGIIDNGSRYCVSLERVGDKTSTTLLRALLDTIEKHGKPKSLRTDNEACFTSRLFRFGLWWFGIKHQRSDKHCPWQNGKIERFFGTMKERLNNYTLSSLRLEQDIQQFVSWYNHVRPHYHLNGKTPAEQHLNKSVNKRGKNQYVYFWNGALTGFYLPPD